MKPELFERIQRIFREATPLDADARRVFLDEACGDDAALREEVESLLEVLDKRTAACFLEEPALEDVGRVAIPERIGRYRILEPIGEGGFAVVYLAEQTEPVRRRVALKMIKPGLDTRQVIARFEAERQALALMDHPHVAKVFDAGATDAGRPFFVMELVKGVPITEYCDQHKLGSAERLELFIDVCHAVQHAHQKGIIHRDLKPSNVLVSVNEGVAAPKVIDFGIAKAMHRPLTDRTVYTEQRQFIGTPEYMSPEQAEMSGLDIDTRSDIYSLGVLLYEMLTGTSPFDPKRLRSASYGEIQRIIREEEPERPSTRLSSLPSTREVAEHRHMDVASLIRSLRGDMDWIVMKAMEKDRTRRYDTANAFAADIVRHLHHEPVSASPPSAAYRFRKFARRNRGAFVTLSSVGAAMAVGLAIAVYGFIVASRERDAKEIARGEAVEALGREQAARAESDAVTEFLSDMLAAVDPARAGREVLVADVLDEASRQIGEEFGDHALIEARLRITMAWTYRTLGLYEKAEAQALSSLEIRRPLLGPEHADTLRSASILADVYHKLERYDEAETLNRETLDIQTRTLGDEHPATLVSMNGLANACWSQDRFEEAERLYVRTLEIRRRTLGDEHPDTLRSIVNLANLLWSLERYDEAEAHYSSSMEARRRILGEAHPDTLDSMYNLAVLYRRQERFDEAEPLYRQSLEVRERTLGEDHPDTIWSMNNLGVMLWARERHAEAEPLFARALEGRRRTLGDEHPHTLKSMNNLASLYAELGRNDDAEALQTSALEIRRRELGHEHPDTLQSIDNLGILYLRLERYEEAEPLFVESLETNRRTHGDDHADTLQSLSYLTWLYNKLRRYAELVELYESLGRPDEAAPWREKLDTP